LSVPLINVFLSKTLGIFVKSEFLFSNFLKVFVSGLLVVIIFVFQPLLPFTNKAPVYLGMLFNCVIFISTLKISRLSLLQQAYSLAYLL